MAKQALAASESHCFHCKRHKECLVPCADNKRRVHQPGVLLHLTSPDRPTVLCQGVARLAQPAITPQCDAHAAASRIGNGCFEAHVLCVQVLLAADMSVASDDGASLFGKTDMPLNTAAGMANEVANNGYTLTTMIGDLAYAEYNAAANSCLASFPIAEVDNAMYWQLTACVSAVCAAVTSVSALHPDLAFPRVLHIFACLKQAPDTECMQVTGMST